MELSNLSIMIVKRLFLVPTKSQLLGNFSALLLAGITATALPLLGADKIDLSKIDISKLPAGSDKRGLTYDKDIRPMLEASCFRCHGQRRPKAGLQLDSLEAALRGGEDGKVIVPGDSKHSLLVIAAARIDDETAMPPKRGPGGPGPGPGGFGGPGGPATPPGGPDGTGPKSGAPNSPPGGPGRPGEPGFGPPPKPLTAEQVGLLRAWIDQGAK